MLLGGKIKGDIAKADVQLPRDTGEGGLAIPFLDEQLCADLHDPCARAGASFFKRHLSAPFVLFPNLQDY